MSTSTAGINQVGKCDPDCLNYSPHNTGPPGSSANDTTTEPTHQVDPMTFSILDHVEKLTPAKEKGKYICPVCEGNDLAIHPKTGAYSCFSNGCDTADIRNAIAPLPQGQRSPGPGKRKSKGKRLSAREKDRAAHQKAIAVEVKVDDLLLSVAEGYHTKEQALIELSNWAKDEGFDAFDAKQLFKAKAKDSGIGKKATTPKPSKVAADLREKYQGRLSFNTQAEQWLYYGHTKDGLWDTIPDAELEAIIQADLDSWPGLEDGYNMGFVSSVVGLLRGRLNRYAWDEQPNMLPFSNGVYDLATGKLEPHAPGYGFTWQLPRPYVAIAASFPKIDAWLDEATGGKAELKTILLCWLNAILKGRSDLQKFLHLVGPGGTGKGTFLRLATTLIGEGNTHSSALDVLCQDKFEVSNLVGKRLVTFSDEDKYTGRLGIFKQLTGGDLLRAEQKHKSAYPFRYQGLAMVASNYPIFAGDTSSGLHRRVLMVPFTVQCPAEKRRNLEAEFEPELAALTTYLLSLEDDFVAQTLLGVGGQSAEVTELSWEMRMRTDSLAAWLNECVVKKPAAEGYYEEVGSNTDDRLSLFGSYYQWCKATGSKPVGLREFSPRLLDLCQAVIGWTDVEKRRLTTGDHKGRHAIAGLKLRTDTTPDPCPIDALIEAAKVKGEGWSEGKVKDTVKAETPALKGGEGCEESNTFYGAKKRSVAPSPSLKSQKPEQKNKISKKSSSDPSHPSPQDTARVSAFTPSFTDSSLHPSPGANLVHRRTGEAAVMVKPDEDGFIWIAPASGGQHRLVAESDWQAIAA